MDKLQISITQVPNGFEVVASVIENTVIPVEIFLYENVGTATLGQFMGVVSASDFPIRAIWTGEEMPTFGNRFVRTAGFTRTYADKKAAESVAANILAGAKKLKLDLSQVAPISSIHVL